MNTEGLTEVAVKEALPVVEQVVETPPELEPSPPVIVAETTAANTRVGEVIARGPNIMMGYYEDADATGAVLKAGWLHTGDLGRFDADGNLYIVGR